MSAVEVEIWVGGTQHATTHRLTSVSPVASTWTDDDVRQLLPELLLALAREKDTGGEPPAVTLRGFSWIAIRNDSGGVLLHLHMQMGTASAGPFPIDEERLKEIVARVMEHPAPTQVH